MVAADMVRELVDEPGDVGLLARSCGFGPACRLGRGVWRSLDCVTVGDGCEVGEVGRGRFGAVYRGVGVG
jgi:hypothetical protein